MRPGSIPSEWTERKLKELSPSQSVGVVVNPSSYFDAAGTVPFLVGSNVGENTIEWESARRITEASNQRLIGSRLNAGDLVTVRVGEPGVTAVVPQALHGCNCASMMVIRQHPSFDSEWLCYVMNSRVGRAQVEGVQYGTAQKQFNISDAINFVYPVPPLAEQKAIAAALSDVDGLLGALDRLIAKKRDLKQAAMQQLLTGQTRLPGFSGKWERGRLEGLSAFITKGSTPTTYGYSWETDGVLFLRSECVSDEGLDLRQSMFISESAHATLRRSEIRNGDILMTITGNVGRVVLLEGLTGTANINQHIARIRIYADRAHPPFVYHFLSQRIIREYYSSITTGQAYPQISLQQVRKTEVPLPSIQEQEAVAAVLSDMDVELTALEQRRDKTRLLKQGMMQELLTGRTRLV